MNPDQTIELAKQAGGDKLWLFPHVNNINYWVFTEEEFQHFVHLLRNEVLEEAVEALYGNGLEKSLLRELREQIRSLKK